MNAELGRQRRRKRHRSRGRGAGSGSAGTPTLPQSAHSRRQSTQTIAPSMRPMVETFRSTVGLSQYAHLCIGKSCFRKPRQ